MDQCTTLFVVGHAGPRALTRLLMAVDGRGASVAGIVTTAEEGTALLWTRHAPERSDHLVAALRRTSGVLRVRPVRRIPDCGTVLHHRSHVGVGGVVDVSIRVVVDGSLVHGAGDGRTLVDATSMAVAACRPSWTPPRHTWIVVDPTTGAPCAVADIGGTVLCSWADSPERAVLSLLLAAGQDGAADVPQPLTVAGAR